MANVEEYQITYVCGDYDKLVKRVEELEARLKITTEVDARRSSIEVGTPAKGGAVKVYLDPFGDKAKNDEAVLEAIRLLKLAGGSPAGGV